MVQQAQDFFQSPKRFWPSEPWRGAPEIVNASIFRPNPEPNILLSMGSVPFCGLVLVPKPNILSMGSVPVWGPRHLLDGGRNPAEAPKRPVAQQALLLGRPSKDPRPEDEQESIAEGGREET